MPEAWNRYGLLPPLYEDCGEGWRSRIALWPDTISIRLPEAPPIRVWHGRPGDPWRGVLPGDEVDFEEAILITAHTHLPFDVECRGKRIVNPGSVGVPLDGDRRASYARFEFLDGNWRVSHQRVGYDEAKLEEAFRSSDFLRRNGSLADLVKKEFDLAELHVLPFLAFQKEESLTEVEARARYSREIRRRYTPPEYRAAV